MVERVESVGNHRGGDLDLGRTKNRHFPNLTGQADHAVHGQITQQTVAISEETAIAANSLTEEANRLGGYACLLMTQVKGALLARAQKLPIPDGDALEA